MAKGIFVTGTGTDVRKRHMSALIVKKLADARESMQAIIRLHYQGAESIEEVTQAM